MNAVPPRPTRLALAIHDHECSTKDWYSSRGMVTTEDIMRADRHPLAVLARRAGYTALNNAVRHHPGPRLWSEWGALVDDIVDAVASELYVEQTRGVSPHGPPKEPDWGKVVDLMVEAMR